MRGGWPCAMLAMLLLWGGSSVQPVEVHAQSADTGFDVFSDSKPMIRLIRKGKRVGVDYSDDWQDYQEVTGNVRRKMQSNGSSSSRGGGGWYTKMQGNGGVFAIVYGTRTFPNMPLMMESAGGLAILFQQTDAPFNELRMAAGPDHQTLKLQLVRPADDFLFTFEQKENGSIQCKLLSGTEIVSMSARDYESLVRENWRQINASIAPVLRQCGVEPPVNRYTKIVWTQFLAMLRPTDGVAQGEFETVVAQLDSTRFTDRETATETLKKQYEKWQIFIQKAAVDSQRSIECRSRLSKILAEFSSQEQKQGQAVVNTLDLANDATYLLWLANRLQDESDWQADRKFVFERLATVTGQSFGDDLAQWNQHLNSAKGPAEVARDTSQFVSEIDLTVQKGPIDSVRSEIGNLLPLTVVDQKLQLNRSHWNTFFGEKSPQQLMEELSAVLKENHLPADWIRPSGIYNRDTVGFPQILFRSLKLKLGEPQEGPSPAAKRYIRISRRSLNRDFDLPAAKASLRLHKPLPENQRELFVMNGRVVNGVAVADKKQMTEEFLFLEIQEKSGAKRKLSFQATPAGDLSLAISFDDGGSLVRYIQNVKPDGSINCVFQDVREGDIFAASADSFSALVSDNRQYFDQEWRVILASFGIQIPAPPSGD